MQGEEDERDPEFLPEVISSQTLGPFRQVDQSSLPWSTDVLLRCNWPTIASVEGDE